MAAVPNAAAEDETLTFELGNIFEENSLEIE